MISVAWRKSVKAPVPTKRNPKYVASVIKTAEIYHALDQGSLSRSPLAFNLFAAEPVRHLYKEIDGHELYLHCFFPDGHDSQKDRVGKFVFSLVVDGWGNSQTVLPPVRIPCRSWNGGHIGRVIKIETRPLLLNV